MLVDEGKIAWDDPVIERLPDFQMYDPYVTREMTIRDLLTHRSGLGLGAGDLLFCPADRPTRATRSSHRLRYMKPASSFRSRYAYDNLLYVVAGQIIPAVTGQSWDDFVRERIFEPLGMTRARDRRRSAAGRRRTWRRRTAKLDGAAASRSRRRAIDNAGPAGVDQLERQRTWRSG